MLQPRILARVGARIPRSAPLKTSYTPLIRRLHISSADEDVLVSGATNKPLLPPKPLIEWESAYRVSKVNGTSERSWLYNETTAKHVVETYNLDDGGPAKTVIEIYPGPGILSRFLLTLPRTVLKKLIILEFTNAFHPELVELAAADDRVVLVKESAFYWKVYQDLQAKGHLDDVPRLDWTQVHPSLRIVGHIPMHILAEQFLAQIIHHVADCAWMWQFGRFPVQLLMAQRTWRRLTATPDLHKTEICKLSIITQAGCDLEETMPLEDLQPYDHHFFPHSRASGNKRGSRGAGNPFVSCKITPKAQPLITLQNIEQWDFVLRQLYGARCKPLKQALLSLAPGAAVLLKAVEGQIDPDKPINALTVHDWDLLIKAFNEWPFRPEILTMLTAKDWEIRTESQHTRI